MLQRSLQLKALCPAFGGPIVRVFCTIGWIVNVLIKEHCSGSHDLGLSLPVLWEDCNFWNSLFCSLRSVEPNLVLVAEKGGRRGGQHVGSLSCMDLVGLVTTLLSSASGEKQECSSGAGHSAAVPASACQCPAAVQEPSGQPAHQPLSLSQPQGNQGCLLSKRKLWYWQGIKQVGFLDVKQRRSKVRRGEESVEIRPTHPKVSPEKLITITQNEDKPVMGHWFAFILFCYLIGSGRFKEGRGGVLEEGWLLTGRVGREVTQEVRAPGVSTPAAVPQPSVRCTCLWWIW